MPEPTDREQEPTAPEPTVIDYAGPRTPDTLQGAEWPVRAVAWVAAIGFLWWIGSLLLNFARVELLPSALVGLAGVVFLTAVGLGVIGRRKRREP